ncbi:MAG: heavy-metal-associated domain-containing protein [Ignavibacteriae bacterium]|nr:heavy-metal-associated domain-containing protein [Ignavibacteriota bacterium]
MSTLKFKTNIKCNNCVAKVSQYLDESYKIKEWSVDLEDPDRVLTVTGEEISGEYIKETVMKAGYKAEEII